MLFPGKIFVILRDRSLPGITKPSYSASDTPHVDICLLFQDLGSIPQPRLCVKSQRSWAPYPKEPKNHCTLKPAGCTPQPQLPRTHSTLCFSHYSPPPCSPLSTSLFRYLPHPTRVYPLSRPLKPGTPFQGAPSASVPSSGTRGTGECRQAGKAGRQRSVRKCAPIEFPRAPSAGRPRTHLP